MSQTLAGLEIDADGQAVSAARGVLVELTRRVDLMVVGSRGCAPCAGSLLGSNHGFARRSIDSTMRAT